MVAKLAPDFPLGQRLSSVTAGTLCRISKAITDPARQPWLKVVEGADTATTERAGQPHSATHDATACPDQWHNNDAAADKLQIESGRVQSHHPQPRKTKVGAKS